MGTLQDVRDTVEQEGFDYTFRSYSDFEDVKDRTFHDLVSIYTEAADKLEQYLDDNTEEPEEY